MRFSYITRNENGVLTRGELEAASRMAAMESLRSQGSRPVSIAHVPIASPRFHLLRSAFLGDWLSPRSYDVETAMQQLALMIRNGLGLVPSLQSVGAQSKSGPFRRIVSAMVTDLQNGKSLYFAMKKHGVFPRILTQLIDVGESTGERADVLERGAKHMAKQRQRVAAFYALLAYPSFILIAATGVSFYLVLFVIPKVQTFLTTMGRPLPKMTQSLLTFSHMLHSHAFIILIAFIAIIASGYAAYRQRTGRLLLDRLVLKLPVLGTIARLAGTITFSSTLSALLRNGVSLVDALATVEKLHSNQHLSATVNAARRAVVRGQSLTDSLGQTSAYMPMLARMLAIAEQTGKTNEVLDQVTAFHEEQLVIQSKRVGTWIEPLLIVIVGGIVGYIYIAFFIALMSAGGTSR